MAVSSTGIDALDSGGVWVLRKFLVKGGRA